MMVMMVMVMEIKKKKGETLKRTRRGWGRENGD